MVIALYAVIVIPIFAYLIFSVLEIWIAYGIAVRKHKRSLLFVQASTEVTHTLLVFAYAQFMITFSALLVHIGAQLWWPIALLIISILLRGTMYLLLFYRERPPAWMYRLLLVTYFMGVSALIWGMAVIIPNIISRHFVPDTSNMGIVIFFGVPVLTLVMIPLIAIYSRALKQINK